MKSQRQWCMSALAMSLLFAGASVVAADVSRKALPDSVYTVPALRVSVTPARKLNVLCMGSGRPTVLLDAGAGFNMVLWRHVQGQVARITRVCAYDRAGYGFSDAMGSALDVDHVAEDIHRLVGTPGVSGPVVYVGHSVAGLYAIRLQATHPEDVLGLVLVDPAFVGQFGRMTNEFSAASKTSLLNAFAQHLADLRRCNDLALSGALANADKEIARLCVSVSGYPEALDASLRSALEHQNRQPKVAAALLSEYSSLLAQGSMTTVNDKEIGGNPVPFGDKPLLILTHGNAEALLPGTSDVDTARSTKAWREGHAALARTSTGEA